MKIFQKILNIFFPPRCAVCNAEGTFLCQKCLNQIIPLSEQVCPVCKRPSRHGATCVDCQTHTHLDGLIVLAHYQHNPVLRKAIQRAKYSGYRDTLPILGKLLLRKLSEEKLGKVVLVPVPLHWWKKLSRGFNQTEILLQSARKNSVQNLLVRTHYTTSQVRAGSREARLQNFKNAFVCSKNLVRCSETFVIIDDVSSTGKTLEDCARALRKAGARKVYGLVLARGQ